MQITDFTAIVSAMFLDCHATNSENLELKESVSH